MEGQNRESVITYILLAIVIPDVVNAYRSVVMTFFLNGQFRG